MDRGTDFDGVEPKLAPHKNFEKTTTRRDLNKSRAIGMRLGQLG
jgi:hypothetical protein